MKVTSFNATEGINGQGKWRDTKPLDKQWSLIDLRTGAEMATVRTYYPGQTCYALVWLRGLGEHGMGYGSAGGGGYCKRSAAVSEAFGRAGLSLSEAVSGVGETAIEEALRAFARHRGLKTNFTIVRAHA